jgi:hypothetical protein
MTPFKRFRLRLVMQFARAMGVPVDVHGSYFGHFSKPPRERGMAPIACGGIGG